MRDFVANQADTRRAYVAFLVRSARTGLNPAVCGLGPFRRLANRVGRAVTQDEVAEACGISRQWYANLEQGVPINISIALADRVANVLMLTTGERNTLFAHLFSELAYLCEAART